MSDGDGEFEKCCLCSKLFSRFYYKMKHLTCQNCNRIFCYECEYTKNTFFMFQEKWYCEVCWDYTDKELLYMFLEKYNKTIENLRDDLKKIPIFVVKNIYMEI
jgi:hypothetical protein